jgi:hypothetical protein
MLVSIRPVSTLAVWLLMWQINGDAVAAVTLDFVLACRVFGHRYRFQAEGTTMRWTCQRGCGAGGEKEYATADEAARYAAAFDREDRDEVGRRAPFLGMFPLRMWWTLRNKRR